MAAGQRTTVAERTESFVAAYLSVDSRDVLGEMEVLLKQAFEMLHAFDVGQIVGQRTLMFPRWYLHEILREKIVAARTREPDEIYLVGLLMELKRGGENIRAVVQQVHETLPFVTQTVHLRFDGSGRVMTARDQTFADILRSTYDCFVALAKKPSESTVEDTQARSLPSRLS